MVSGVGQGIITASTDTEDGHIDLLIIYVKIVVKIIGMVKLIVG